jgi:hypothetical protein
MELSKGDEVIYLGDVFGGRTGKIMVDGNEQSVHPSRLTVGKSYMIQSISSDNTLWIISDSGEELGYNPAHYKFDGLMALRRKKMANLKKVLRKKKKKIVKT